MSRFIPEHPKKGTAEAYAWAEKMRAAREKKKRLRHQIRQAGLATEQEFFGPGGPLAPKAVKKHKLNPGAAWHEGMAQVAGRYRKQAPTQTEKHIFAGMEQAHKDSASAAKKLGMNPFEERRPQPKKQFHVLDSHSDTRHPLASFSTSQKAFNAIRKRNLSLKRFIVVDAYYMQVKPSKSRHRKNPIAVFNPPKVAGTIYNNAIEIKAQKTGGPLKGHYKHIFESKKVKILGLTDGTVLLQHTEGKPLWMTRKDYERSGRKH